MIWCRLEHAGRPQYGLVEDDDTVRLVDGDPFAGHAPTSTRIPLAEVRLLAPVEPRTFFCAGLNYRAHIEHARARGNPAAVVPEHPEVGYRANNALVGHGDDIVVPSDVTGVVEAEPEVAAVIGRPLRHASRSEARAGILGWTIGNDVSARSWQRSDRTLWRAKNCDTFKPMGPWIVAGADPAEATTTTRVNGRNVLTFATGDMIFDAADFIVAITRYITMQPGDVLWMGADGTAAIAPGDTVEINVTGIGTLRNRVVAESANHRERTAA